MLYDKQNEFSNAQAITATAASTNYIDAATTRNLGVGEQLFVCMLITTAFTDSSSDSTVTPSLEVDDNTSFSSPATIATYPVFAALTAINMLRFFHLDPITPTGSYERYMQLRYTVANGNLTTGSITAFIVKDIAAFRAYAVGYTVS